MESRLLSIVKDGRFVVPRCDYFWLEWVGVGWWVVWVDGLGGHQRWQDGASLPPAATPPTPEPGGGGANACPSAEEEVHTIPDLHQQPEKKSRRTESMKLVLEAGKIIN